MTMTTTPGRPQPRQTVDEYRRQRAALDTAKAQLLANGEVVTIDPPPTATAAALEQLQGGWERLRTRTVAALEAQGKTDQEGLEAEFFSSTVDVLSYRQQTKAREERTAQAVAQAQAMGGVRYREAEDAAHAAGTEAVARVWQQVLQHGQAQLAQAAQRFEAEQTKT